MAVAAARRAEVPSPSPIAPAAERVSVCDEPRPLPLAAHWTGGTRTHTGYSTSPRWQLEQIRSGHHWLLTFHHWALPVRWTREISGYFQALVQAREQGLPIAITFPQWEQHLYKEQRWRSLPADRSPRMLGTDGRLRDRLSPFGAVEPWSEVGRWWANSEVLGEIRRLYPDPPYVLLISNNEAKRLRLRDAEKSARFHALGREDWSAADRRKRFGDGYVERYRAMLTAFRESLGSWSDRAIFTTWGGLDPFMGARLKRGSRRTWLDGVQPNFGFPVPGRLSIVPEIWDGVSARYYVVGERGEDDRSLYSANVRVMTYPAQIADACAVAPDLFLELSAWMSPGYVAAERAGGRDMGAPRYEGFLKWGMWIARPQVVRAFDLKDRTLVQVAARLDALQRSVDEVHRDATLSAFWRGERARPASERAASGRTRDPGVDSFPAAMVRVGLDREPESPLGSEHTIPGLGPGASARNVRTERVARFRAEPERAAHRVRDRRARRRVVPAGRDFGRPLLPREARIRRRTPGHVDRAIGPPRPRRRGSMAISSASVCASNGRSHACDGSEGGSRSG